MAAYRLVTKRFSAEPIFFARRERLHYFPRFLENNANSEQGRKNRVKLFRNKSMNGQYERLSPVRIATITDLPDIMELIRGNIGTPGCTWNEEYPSAEFITEDIERQMLYLLRANSAGGALVAVAALLEIPEFDYLPWSVTNACDMARFGVAKHCHRKGIGKHMLGEMIKIAKAKGYGGIRLLAAKINPAAIGLYESAGFTRRGEAYLFDVDWWLYELGLRV